MKHSDERYTYRRKTLILKGCHFLHIGLIEKNNLGVYRNRKFNLRYYFNQNKFG